MEAVLPNLKHLVPAGGDDVVALRAHVHGVHCEPVERRRLLHESAGGHVVPDEPAVRRRGHELGAVRGEPDAAKGRERPLVPEQDGSDTALAAEKVEVAFKALLAAPLAALPPRSAQAPRLVIILDALDELSAQQLGPVLDLITTWLATLPDWLRLFVTSRDETAIKAALCGAGLEPEEVSRMELGPMAAAAAAPAAAALPFCAHLAPPACCHSCAWTRRATRRTCART